MEIILIILAFGLTVLVHEWGHFIAARKNGVKVHTFAIGMGPRIWKVFTDKQGCDFVICLLPIGGYVRMKGQEDLPTAHMPDAHDDDSFSAKKPWQRAIILVAGVVMNVVFAFFLLILAYLIGVPFTSNKVAAVSEQSPLAASRLAPGDTIIQVDGKKVYSYEDVRERAALKKTNEQVHLRVKDLSGNEYSLETRTYFANETWLPEGMPVLGIIPKVDAYLQAGGPESEKKAIHSLRLTNSEYPVYNPRGITRIVNTFPGRAVEVQTYGQNGSIWTNIRTLSDVQTNGLPIDYYACVDVLENSPAQKAGLENGDIIQTANGETVRGFYHFIEITDRLINDPVLELEIKRPDGITNIVIRPEYNRQAEKYLIGVYPSKTYERRFKRLSWVHPPLATNILQAGSRILDESADKEAIKLTLEDDGKSLAYTIYPKDYPAKIQGSLGQMTFSDHLVRLGLIESIPRAFVGIGQEIQKTYGFLKQLVTGAISAKNMGGPIGIVQSSFQIIKHKGIAYFIYIFVKIGISLAVLNLLPIPVLDGGHLLFVFYEMIFKKPPAPQWMVGFQMAGLFLLLFLMIFVSFNDLSRLFGS